MSIYTDIVKNVPLDLTVPGLTLTRNLDEISVVTAQLIAQLANLCFVVVVLETWRVNYRPALEVRGDDMCYLPVPGPGGV